MADEISDFIDTYNKIDKEINSLRSNFEIVQEWVNCELFEPCSSNIVVSKKNDKLKNDLILFSHGVELCRLDQEFIYSRQASLPHHFNCNKGFCK